MPVSTVPLSIWHQRTLGAAVFVKARLSSALTMGTSACGRQRCGTHHANFTVLTVVMQEDAELSKFMEQERTRLTTELYNNEPDASVEFDEFGWSREMKTLVNWRAAEVSIPARTRKQIKERSVAQCCINLCVYLILF